MYSIVYTKKSFKDIPKLKSSNLDDKAQSLIDILGENPYQNPPSFEKLVGDLQGAHSRRINIQHRLVYEVIEGSRTVKIISMWSHYNL